MSNIEELIIRRKKENIVLNVIIIIICLISLIFFGNDFEKVLNNDYFIINSKESLEEAIKEAEEKYNTRVIFVIGSFYVYKKVIDIIKRWGIKW